LEVAVECGGIVFSFLTHWFVLSIVGGLIWIRGDREAVRQRGREHWCSRGG
jgi:hypothetical protein